MKNQTDFKSNLWVWAVMAIPIIWFAAILAYTYQPGMNVIALMGRFTDMVERPFSIGWTAYTMRFVCIALCLYALCIALYYSTRENRRPGEEYGSAKWGSPKAVNAKFRDKNPTRNMILTRNISMGLNGYQHKRNLLQICLGGSGAGKTRYYCLPNLLQANCSYIVTDPKGEMLRAVAPLLIREGYVIKVFDLVETLNSDGFNPFDYIKDDKDAMKLISNLIKNTTPKNSQQSDPFWERAEQALTTALILYLKHFAIRDEQNLETIMYMLENGGAREDNEDFQSPLDLLFDALEEEVPNHVAVREYKVFKQGAGKTARSILISAAVRLSAFILPEIARITHADDLELGMLGERKQAVFCVIPDNDGTFSYLVGLLYTCAFQELYYRADKIHKGRLPYPVRIIMDEFCNVALPDEFRKIQSTMRSRNIFSNIVLQNISDLKAIYKDEWEGLIGNADTMIYLGGNEKSTHSYISESLGKETLVVKSTSMSRGSHGSYSTSTQLVGRELLTPDEVRAMNNDYAIVFIRGEYPVMDAKYDLMKHPNIAHTEYGGEQPYTHRPWLDYSEDDMGFFISSLDELKIFDEQEIAS